MRNQEQSLGNDKKKYSIASDDNPLGAIPEQERKGMFSMMVVLLGFTFFTSTMFAGGNLGPRMQFYPELIVAIIIGNLALGVYVAFIGYISQKTGYNSSLLSRYSMGEKGSAIADILFGLTEFGWYAWGTATIAMVFVKFLGIDTRWTIPFMILFGYAFSVTSYIGYRGIQMLSNIAVPAMAILMLVSFRIGIKDVGGFAGLMRTPENPMSMAEAITIVFGSFVAGGTQATNWIRFSKTKKIAVVSSLVAFFIGNGLMIFIGAFGGYVYKQPDIVEVMLIQGLRIPALFMLFFNVWTTQDNTIYCTSTAGAHLFRTNNRRLINFIATTGAIILAMVGMYNWLVPYIIIMGIAVPPIGGVILADYFIKNKRKYLPINKLKMKKYNYTGLIAYVVGVLFAFFSPGIRPMNGIISAFISYPIIDWLLVKFNVPQKNEILNAE